MDERRRTIEEQERMLKIRMRKIRHKIAIISGKGGVGKSTVAVNLAIAFAINGHRVGILDADIHGPSIPKMLGLSGNRLEVGPPGIFPAIGPFNIRVVSMDFPLPDENTPVIWRGPLKMSAIRQFLSDIVWGDLNLLLIDLPPGTGDEPLSVAQLLPEMDGVIIVTIPSEVSQIVVKKAVSFTKTLGLPIIGVIENMSGFVCPNCGARVDIFQFGGGERIADEMGIPFLGRIPIDQKICENSDKGKPFIAEYRDSPASEAFMEIVRKIEDFLNRREIGISSESGEGGELR
ncbi:Mrp/NBP35 family ATP-binding protein [Candidatus Bathyarchaeota archaeon]|nr:Mrp/NBP35 family ATP-binding protein [Candidatus Bathyarchaeota archaeon]